MVRRWRWATRRKSDASCSGALFFFSCLHQSGGWLRRVFPADGAPCGPCLLWSRQPPMASLLLPVLGDVPCGRGALEVVGGGGLLAGCFFVCAFAKGEPPSARSALALRPRMPMRSGAGRHGNCRRQRTPGRKTRRRAQFFFCLGRRDDCVEPRGSSSPWRSPNENAGGGSTGEAHRRQQRLTRRAMAAPLVPPYAAERWPVGKSSRWPLSPGA